MTKIPDEIRRLVVSRANGRCEYCHVTEAGQVAVFPIDHIQPRSVGGATHPDNLAVACPRCNAHKWAHTDGHEPSIGSVPLFHPRQDNWDDHFEWSAERLAELIGKTPVGRATISRLCMNDPEIITIRRLLIQLGLMSVTPATH